MNFKNFAIAMTMGLTLSNIASADVVCTSAPDSTGGTVTVTIAQNADGQPTVSFKVLGGFSHREMLTGPFVATKRPQIESAVYSFKDQNGELGSVSLVTSAIGGSLHTTASINYSSFKSNLALPCKVVKAQ